MDFSLFSNFTSCRSRVRSQLPDRKHGRGGRPGRDGRAEPAETPDASEETTDVPSLLSEGDGSDTPAPEEQTVTNTETETEAPAEKTETKQEESTEPEKQTVTNTDTETKAPAKKTETKQEESTESAKQTVTNTDNETKEPATKTSDDVSKESDQPSAFKGKYEDDSIIISVSAEPGIVPEGAQLSVTPIEKTEITNDMTDEEKAEAEQINAQYDLTEKKLTEDSEKNEETMEGFLAYDISFIVNGVEVEPTGDVKVTMDFKEAAIPEGVSEDSEVSVKHLKEDKTAEDGVVVEDMATKASVQTTSQAEVEKVELTAESFSTFTITWSGKRFEKPVEITFIDTSGNVINVENEDEYDLTLNRDEVFRTSDITSNGEYSKYYQIINTNNETYTFVKALNIWNDPKTDAGSEFTQLRIQDEKLQWYNVKNNLNEWENPNDQDKFYFVYEFSEVEPGGTTDLSKADTIDTTGLITMRMIDYSSAADGLDSALAGQYGNGTVKQNLVKRVLQNGYPVISNSNTSLARLFSGGNAVNATDLFLQSTFGETGYYEYSSFENYAYFNEDTGHFTVYDQIGTPVKDNSAYYFKRGNFLPYSQIVNKQYAKYGNLYDPDGTRLNDGDHRYNETLYYAGNGQSDADKFYFGMYLKQILHNLGMGRLNTMAINLI